MIDNGMFAMVLLVVSALIGLIIYSVASGNYEEHQQCIEQKIVEHGTDYNGARYLCRRLP